MGPEFNHEGFRGTGSDDLHLGERDCGTSSSPLSPVAEGGVGEVMLLCERGGREPAAVELSQELLASGGGGSGTADRRGQEVWFHVPVSYRVPGRSGRGSLPHRFYSQLVLGATGTLLVITGGPMSVSVATLLVIEPAPWE